MAIFQEWVQKISLDDRKKLQKAMRFDSHPREFLDVMAELRSRYDFIPAESEVEPMEVSVHVEQLVKLLSFADEALDLQDSEFSNYPMRKTGSF